MYYLTVLLYCCTTLWRWKCTPRSVGGQRKHPCIILSDQIIMDLGRLVPITLYSLCSEAFHSKISLITMRSTSSFIHENHTTHLSNFTSAYCVQRYCKDNVHRCPNCPQYLGRAPCRPQALSPDPRRRRTNSAEQRGTWNPANKISYLYNIYLQNVYRISIRYLQNTEYLYFSLCFAIVVVN